MEGKRFRGKEVDTDMMASVGIQYASRKAIHRLPAIAPYSTVSASAALHVRLWAKSVV